MSSYVCLPFMIAALAALFVEPSRHVGIWIQVGELLFFCATLWTYFYRVLRLSGGIALLAAAPLLLAQCLYLSNGGVSDFRMDLSLMLLFGATCLWYLIAVRGTALWPYALLGLSCAATCLFRGTAPVYLVLALGPVALWDVLFLRRDRAHWLGLGTAVAIAAALSLWFYVRNFAHLHYYYFVWNTDANAHLPLRDSLQHLKFVRHHIGTPAFLYLFVFQGVVLWSRWRASGYSPRSTLAGLREDFRQFDVRPLWLGLAPVLFLVVRGAGLNPFVSMPAVVGLCLFLLFPLPHPRKLQLTWPMAACLLLVLALSATPVDRRGWRDHVGHNPLSMAAHQATLDILLADAEAHGKTEARFATAHCFFLNPKSLESVAMFDRAGTQSNSAGVAERGVALRPDESLNLAAEADWRQVAGETDAAKLSHLAQHVAAKVDYLIIPTAECSRSLQECVAFNVVNRHAVPLRSEILASGNWELISAEIANRDDEVVQIYRNRRRVPAATAALSASAGRNNRRQ